jgi:hypothetical protein
MMGPRIYDSMPPSVFDYFTDEYPLGPVTTERILEPAASAFLLNPETSAFKGVMNGASIILGRRGSGKSALLASLVDRSGLQVYLKEFFGQNLKSYGPTSELKKDYFVTIRINAPTEMAAVDNMIRNRTFPTLEGAADAWHSRIMHNILLHFINSETARLGLPPALRAAIKQIVRISKTDARKPLPMNKLIAAINAAHKNRLSLLADLETALVERGRRALILIDTMEEYRIREAAVTDVVGGLLYEIARQSEQRSAFEIKAALPTEIYRLVRDAGAPGRIALPMEFIHWTPRHLLQIAAHRALLMVRQRQPNFYADLSNALDPEAYGLSPKSSLRVLKAFFGALCTNEGGVPEEPANVLLRHTMLLPRQLINTMSFAFKAALNDTGTLIVQPSHLAKALNDGAATVVAEVYAAYRHVYADIAHVAPSFLRETASVSGYGDLQIAYNHSVKGRYTHDYVEGFPSFLEAMIDCGFLGVAGERTPRYVEAQFAYNTLTSPNYTSRSQFAVHPAATRRYGARQDTRHAQVVLPLGSVAEEE